MGKLEKAFDYAGVRTTSHECSVGAFSKEKLHCPKDDGFSRTGLARDGHETAGWFPEEILDQGEVADTQRCQRCGHLLSMPRFASDSKRCRIFKSHFSAQAHRTASR